MFIRRLGDTVSGPNCKRCRSQWEQNNRSVFYSCNESRSMYLCNSLGILTKPDLLQDGAIGARERWMQIFTGDDPIRKTKHGYYCVRLPDDLQRRGDNTRAKAQETERDFFTTRSPWNLLPPRDKSRCGIPNFVKDISALLVELIEQ